MVGFFIGFFTGQNKLGIHIKNVMAAFFGFCPEVVPGTAMIFIKQIAPRFSIGNDKINIVNFLFPTEFFTVKIIIEYEIF
jgi:hypothetical protein